jgi:hypothetical protein
LFEISQSEYSLDRRMTPDFTPVIWSIWTLFYPKETTSKLIFAEVYSYLEKLILMRKN